MWKTTAGPRTAGLCRSTGAVEKKKVFHREMAGNGRTWLSTAGGISLHRKLWKEECRYKEELMLAVMSRRVSCREELGSFRVISTLRME